MYRFKVSFHLMHYKIGVVFIGYCSHRMIPKLRPSQSVVECKQKRVEKEELTVANLSTRITFIIPLSHPVYLHGFYLVISSDWIDAYMYIAFEIKPKDDTPVSQSIPYRYMSRRKRWRDLAESYRIEHQHKIKKHTHTHINCTIQSLFLLVPMPKHEKIDMSHEKR